MGRLVGRLKAGGGGGGGLEREEEDRGRGREEGLTIGEGDGFQEEEEGRGRGEAGMMVVAVVDWREVVREDPASWGRRTRGTSTISTTAEG